VLKSFEATSIWPMDREQILERFNHKASPEASRPSTLTNRDWRQIDRLVLRRLLMLVVINRLVRLELLLKPAEQYFKDWDNLSN
jgi:hypothetical protein